MPYYNKQLREYMRHPVRLRHYIVNSISDWLYVLTLICVGHWFSGWDTVAVFAAVSLAIRLYQIYKRV